MTRPKAKFSCMDSANTYNYNKGMLLDIDAIYICCKKTGYRLLAKLLLNSRQKEAEKNIFQYFRSIAEING